MLGYLTAKFRRTQTIPIDSPVILIDALGVRKSIELADSSELSLLANKLDNQYTTAFKYIRNTIVIREKGTDLSSSAFTSHRFNDMFILFSEKTGQVLHYRFLVSATLIYQYLLAEKMIPRGAIGYGPILKQKDLLLGNGFLDAYNAAETRGPNHNCVCAIQVTNNFLASISKNSYRDINKNRLICEFRNKYYLNPNSLIDPDLGEFTNIRILNYLRDAGTTADKLEKTIDFLENLKPIKI